MKPLDLCARLPASRGQATVEFAVVLLVLVPLFLIVPRLGKLIDLYQSTELASRYVAFEGTVRNTSSTWKDDAQLAQEARQRFYSTADAPIQSSAAVPNRRMPRNPLWSDAAGKPFINNFDTQVSVRTVATPRNAIATAVPSAKALALPNKNHLAAYVTVDPAKIGRLVPFNHMNLDTTRHTVIWVDPWTAREPQQIRDKIMNSTVMYPEGKMRPVLNAMGFLPLLLLEQPIQVGEFDWDIVPCDRLLGGCR